VAAPTGDGDGDRYRRLEALDAPEVMRRVAERNAETLTGLADERFEHVRDALLEVLDSKDRQTAWPYGSSSLFPPTARTFPNSSWAGRTAGRPCSPDTAVSRFR
jgi:prolyl oligopeptidase PreP (S9A serine peptidase family)